MEDKGIKKFVRLFFTEKDNITPCDVRIYGFVFFIILITSIGWFVYKDKATLQDIVNAFLTWLGSVVAGVSGKNKFEGPSDKEQP